MSTFTILLLILIIAILIVFLALHRQQQQDTKEHSQCTCNSKKTGSNNAMCTENNCSILPVTDPAFNLRETAKQMLLLEDHLNNTGKTCRQCIIKHSLTIEGYLEEALCLDCDNKYADEINDLLSNFQKIEQKFLNNYDKKVLAQELRNLRKKIHVKYFAVGLV